jgi:hypothetical protein
MTLLSLASRWIRRWLGALASRWSGRPEPSADPESLLVTSRGGVVIAAAILDCTAEDQAAPVADLSADEVAVARQLEIQCDEQFGRFGWTRSVEELARSGVRVEAIMRRSDRRGTARIGLVVATPPRDDSDCDDDAARATLHSPP